MSTRRTGGLHEISVAIGELKQQAENIADDVKQAHTSRERIHFKLEKLAEEIQRVGNRVTILEAGVSEMKPIVNDLASSKKSIVVGVIIVSAFASVIWGIVSVFTPYIMRLFKISG